MGIILGLLIGQYNARAAIRRGSCGHDYELVEYDRPVAGSFNPLLAVRPEYQGLGQELVQKFIDDGTKNHDKG